MVQYVTNRGNLIIDHKEGQYEWGHNLIRMNHAKLVWNLWKRFYELLFQSGCEPTKFSGMSPPSHHIYSQSICVSFDPQLSTIYSLSQNTSKHFHFHLIIFTPFFIFLSIGLQWPMQDLTQKSYCFHFINWPQIGTCMVNWTNGIALTLSFVKWSRLCSCFWLKIRSM